MIKKVTKEEVENWIKLIEVIHFETTGYKNNFINRGTIEHILFEGLRNNKYDTKENFAAFILVEIAVKHPFWDGNKRTALMIALQSLTTENEDMIQLYPKNWGDRTDKIVKFMTEVAERKRKYDDVLKVIKDRFKLNEE